MESHVAEEVIKKGPWTAEEDEILINFVKKNGPRDWSSIRSNKLLPRTGKSCRLRWVNKLRPNLKIGCKFTAEEERVVLDLQASVGNKWATIASHLPGRTDNDVKNFWSSRQKKLARILHSSSQPSSSRVLKNKGKSLVVDEFPNPQAYEHNTSDQLKQEPSPQCSQSCYPETVKMLPVPDLMNSNLFVDNTNPFLPLQPCSTESQFLLPPFPELPQPKLELPLFPGSHDDYSMELGNGSSLAEDGLVGPSNEYKYFGRDDEQQLETPSDCFLDDFPFDLFDYEIGPMPTSPSAP